MPGDVLGVSSRLTAGLAALAAAAAPSPSTQPVRDYFGAYAQVGEFSGQPLSAPVFRGDKLFGHIARSVDMVRIPTYSGEPINGLIVLDTGGCVVGIKIIEHSEPILLAGVSEADMLDYVERYQGMTACDRVKIGGQSRAGYLTMDGPAGATITVVVLNATIARAARLVAASRGLPLAFDPEEAAKLTAPGQAADDPGLHSPGAMWVDGSSAAFASRYSPRACPTCLRSWYFGTGRRGTLPCSAICARVSWSTRCSSSAGMAWPSCRSSNLLTFANALFSGFDWRTFLIDPMMFILWAFVACTILLWGRGVYCGWRCRFGALQELVNKAALWLVLPQWQIPTAAHERLLAASTRCWWPCSACPCNR